MQKKICSAENSSTCLAVRHIVKKNVTPHNHADHGFRRFIPESKGCHMVLNLSNEFFESPAVHFEMIKSAGMDIGFTQLKPGFLEVPEKGIDTPEDLAEIMKDFFRRIFPVFEA
jgi:hypothetical protein